MCQLDQPYFVHGVSPGAWMLTNGTPTPVLSAQWRMAEMCVVIMILWHDIIMFIQCVCSFYTPVLILTNYLCKFGPGFREFRSINVFFTSLFDQQRRSFR